MKKTRCSSRGKREESKGFEAKLRDPQSNWQQATTYQAGTEAKEEPNDSTPLVEADGAGRNRILSKQPAVISGKENGSKNMNRA